MLSEWLALALLSAATAATLLTCAEKWGWLVWLEVNVGRWWWLPRWAPVGCLFCLGFHLAWVVAVPLACASGRPGWWGLVAGLPAAALTRWLTIAILGR